MRTQHPIAFVRSRDPIADVLADRDHDRQNASWFARRGHDAFAALLHRLRRDRRVQRASIEERLHENDWVTGSLYQAECHVELKLRDTPRIFFVGTGRSARRNLARIVALAEVLERFGFYLERTVLDALGEAGVEERILTRHAELPRSSNGACFHTSPALALQGAICELLERDAFLSNWYADRPLPVSPLSRRSPLTEAARRFGALGWTLRHHVWRHDRAPAWCSMVSLVRTEIRHGAWNFFMCGGASPDPARAAAKALEEVVGLFHFYHLRAEGVAIERFTAADLETPRSRVLYFQQPSVVRRYLARLAPPRSIATKPRLRNSRQFVVDALRGIPDLRVHLLPVPIDLVEHVYCIHATTASLQDLDWVSPFPLNRSRIESRYGSGSVTRRPTPHPIN